MATYIVLIICISLSKIAVYVSNYNYCRGKEKNKIEKEDMRLNAPATTCEELSKIGYTRNGFYLVKGKNATSNSHVELVDCLFANLNGGKEGKDIKYKRKL